ncbi:hypothetical protein DICVIV_11897 [Dictyocaulus viviparus]|uniref:DUS-like FMN-binding domain-containing protein n=1 Tax=Dictyocaulus viviparus TaxID=29172 RepID=A0A0D8XBW9_DICVI|nr:hypothetical protein DICVIV_11897 [Dictyocaulus viviparus]
MVIKGKSFDKRKRRGTAEALMSDAEWKKHPMLLRMEYLTIDSPVILAPMSRVTDCPFRSIVKKLDVSLVASEITARIIPAIAYLFRKMCLVKSYGYLRVSSLNLLCEEQMVVKVELEYEFDDKRFDQHRTAQVQSSIC